MKDSGGTRSLNQRLQKHFRIVLIALDSTGGEVKAQKIIFLR
jgi:hypothetical protein